MRTRKKRCRRRSSDKGLEKGERERRGEEEGGGSIGGATGAGNASLGYPVTKLVRFVQRGPRYVGLSPLKMVQLKPHCSDAAALERDTRQALHRKPEANSLSDAHLLAITKVQPVLFFPLSKFCL